MTNIFHQRVRRFYDSLQTFFIICAYSQTWTNTTQKKMNDNTIDSPIDMGLDIYGGRKKLIVPQTWYIDELIQTD